MIPGINILNIALSLIGSQPVVYYQDSGERETLPNGLLVTNFLPPVTVVSCSVQAVPDSRIVNAGLDETKKYVDWFVPRMVVGLQRDYSGDEIEYDNSRYKVISVENWQSQDGWCIALCQSMDG